MSVALFSASCLNNVDLKHDQNYYYYTNYYGYYQPRDKEPRRSSRRKAAATAASNGYFRSGRILMRSRLSTSSCSSAPAPRRLWPGDVLRVGDPIELKIGGVPHGRADSRSTTPTPSTRTASINLPYINKVQRGRPHAGPARALDRRQLSRRKNLHEPNDHDRDAADSRVS